LKVIRPKVDLDFPYASATLYQDDEGFHYDLTRPQLDCDDQILLAEVEDRIRRMVKDRKSGYHEAVDKEAWYREKIKLLLEPAGASEELIGKLTYVYLEGRLQNYGKINAIRYDPEVEDIACGGNADEELVVFVKHKITGWTPTNLTFTQTEIDEVIKRLAFLGGKQVSTLTPEADVTLPDGSRVHLDFGHEGSEGSLFHIRKWRTKVISPIELVMDGTLSDLSLAYIWIRLQYRASILIVGSTGSGKTVLLNALCAFIPINARILIIENTRELRLMEHKNRAHLTTREASALSAVKGYARDLFAKMKEALRMTPDVVIIGEVQGEEARILFQAMAAGLRGAGTAHTEDPESLLTRFQADPYNIVPTLLTEASPILLMRGYTAPDGLPMRRLAEVVENLGIEEEGAR
jgi:flagellar protein FlaI